MPKKPRPAHLRDAIDSGQTGSKISFGDPAAAPLGTDEEAAGTPVASEDVRRAMRDEVRRPPVHSSEQTRAPGALLPIVILVLTIIAAAILVLIYR
jgi:hypothetical protein